MKWTTLYRKEQGEILFVSIWLTEAAQPYILVERGNLTKHSTDKFVRTKMPNKEAAIDGVSELWNEWCSKGYKSAQELGINSNNQAWTPFTSGSLEQLLQQLL